MRCITIIEPWASLIAVGVKRYETRGWSPDFRGPLAIHAGKKTEFAADALMRDPFRSILAQAGICRLKDFNFGHVLCVVNLVAVHKTEWLRQAISLEERDFGDYGDGRFAWELADVRTFTPQEARGFQKVWNWQPTGFVRDAIDGWKRKLELAVTA